MISNFEIFLYIFIIIIRKIFRKPAIPFDGKERPKVTGDLLLENVSFTYPSRPNNPVLKVSKNFQFIVFML